MRLAVTIAIVLGIVNLGLTGYQFFPEGKDD